MDKRLEQMKAKEQLTSEYVAKRLNYNSETGVFTWKTPTAARLKPGDIAGTSGICFNMQQGKWQAYEKYEKKYKQKHLGYFLNYEEAVVARKQAEKEYGYTVRKEG